MTNFCRYGGTRSIPFAELMAESAADGQLIARAENSGCEGFYCEVAKWNPERKRYERYAFEKFFGGEHPELPDANDQDTATRYAADINTAGHRWDAGEEGMVHSFTNYGELTPLERELLATLTESLTAMERMDAQLLKLTGSPKECEKREIVNARAAIDKATKQAATV